MTTRSELVEALQQGAWTVVDGRYERDNCALVFLSDTTVRYYDGSPVNEDDDTMRAVSGTMPLDAALAWVRRKSATPRG